MLQAAGRAGRALLAMAQRLSSEQRFWALVEKRGADECWHWTGVRDRHGYGRPWFNGKRAGAHRAAWEIANGKPAPEGLFVCHSCDNRICVNPNHLWLGSNVENIKDSQAKGRRPRNPVAEAVRRLGRERQANGRLIAKAPDMLALLKDCEESFTADDSYALLRDACRKLIAEIEQ